MRDRSCVLIVDDEPRGREALELLLGAEGYALAFASDGQEALQQAKSLSPDLILLDVMMPGMDGFEVCQHLRADLVLAEVPVILLTALDDRDSRLRGIEAGADDYICKPFDRIELRARVRTITRLNRYRRLVTERGKFEWVVEHADDGYVLLDREGALQYANPRAGYYLHLPENEARLAPSGFLETAKRYYQLEPEIAWSGWPAQAFDAAPRYLVRPENFTERSLWLQVDSFSLPPDSADSVLVRLRDVSGQMNLQQQAWTFQRLVSHKLRTPLMGLTALQLAKRQIHTLLDEKHLQLFEMAEHNVERLHQQILDILRYVDAPSLLKTGADISLGSMRTLVRELSDNLQVQATVHMPEDFADAHLALSDEALKCILEEIFSNSQKFHPRHTPDIHLKITRTRDDAVRLRISDDGQCLSPEELNKAWLPYYQVEKKFTGEVKGMGLGLPTVASLVWRVGGTCRLLNRQDQPGIVVELNVPLQKGPPRRQ